MLARLEVKHLAVVAAAQVEFGPGFNVITGETGAGKSVLLGALHLVLGGRADRSVVRTGEKEASVCAVYTFEDTHPIDTVLEAADLPLCEGGELILRRTVTAAGQSRVRINDAPATTLLLRQLAPYLTEIHGPEDPQTLLDTSGQLTLLDAFAEDAEERATYACAWQKWKQLEADLEALAGDPAAREAEIEQLTYEVSDIAATAPTEADGEELIERHAQAANAEAILALGNSVAARLTDGEDTIAERLLGVNRSLRELTRMLPDASAWEQELAGIQEQLQALSEGIAIRLSQVDADPEALGHLEHRLAQIQRLRRRYGPSLEDVLAHAQAAQARLDALQHAEGGIARLTAEIAQAKQAVCAAGQALSARRQAALTPLSEAIVKTLRELGFKSAMLPIRCEPCEPTASGMDEVTFYFAPNPGEAERPLAKIASSGELARVMLAIDALLAQHTAVPTLIFDEIDANIGGETGRAVGDKLRTLGKQTQVLCITHLPQCAVYGDTHFCVQKAVVEGRSVTRIVALTEAERAAEVARMLGGADFTSHVLAHAQEMLTYAQKD